ncbi:hypothetical protein P3342_013046 [Pyrenophora teres f. teres]|nr:hypothetical protein P3342_013046 [Pyrenophora teres f. teres]
MDPIANPLAVQVQDVQSVSDGRMQTEPEEIWDDLRRTMSRLTGRSKTGSEAKQSAHQEMEVRSQGRTRSHRTKTIDELGKKSRRYQLWMLRMTFQRAVCVLGLLSHRRV